MEFDPVLPLPIRCKTPWYKSLIGLIACVGFVVGGYYMTQNMDGTRRYSAEFVQMAGWFCIVFFTIGIGAALRMLFMPTYSFEATQDGITARFPLARSKSLAWNDIAFISLGAGPHRATGNMMSIHGKQGQKKIMIGWFNIDMPIARLHAATYHHWMQQRLKD